MTPPRRARAHLAALAAVTPLVLAAAGVASSPKAEPQESRQLLGCSGPAVKGLVRSLVTALNTGDLASVDQLVAKGTAFKWYSVSGAPGRRVGAAAVKRATLLRYLRARHRQKERLDIRSLRFQGPKGGRVGNFNFVVIRTALDYGPKTIIGKGAVDCRRARPKVVVWSLGG